MNPATIDDLTERVATMNRQLGALIRIVKTGAEANAVLVARVEALEAELAAMRGDDYQP